MAITDKSFDINKTDLRLNNSKKAGLQILFGDDWQKWNYLQNQLSYVTPLHISAKISQLAYHYYGKVVKDRALWDMFGGLGMDTVNFAKFFRVIVTELDPKVFATLQLNIAALCTSEAGCKNRVEALNIDALQKQRDKLFLKGIKIIYFDPPWGNSFKTGEPFDFNKISIATTINTDAANVNNVNGSQESSKIINQNIMDLLDKLYEKVQNIIIKSPILSDSFEQWANKKNIPILQICEFPTHKLKYLFLGPM